MPSQIKKYYEEVDRSTMLTDGVAGLLRNNMDNGTGVTNIRMLKWIFTVIMKDRKVNLYISEQLSILPRQRIK